MADKQVIHLSKYIHENPIDIQTFFSISLGLTHLLNAKHQEGIYHVKLNPTCILLNLQTGVLEIIPTEQAGSFINELAYASPEQFGSMDRTYDHRSDLYALGIIMYEMLTKCLPFQANDARGFVHAHMAVLPKSPNVLHPDIPTMICEMVLKLLAKAVESRYQSTLGLVNDLEKCKAEWVSKGQIEPFELGEFEKNSQFRIPNQLYGREKQIQELQAAFERLCSGSMELVWIEGSSGSGKTMLARQIRRFVRQQNGYYVEGKFEQITQDAPHASFIPMFRSLVRQLLAEDEGQLSIWREKFHTVLGQYGSVITHVIPEITLIMGEQPSMGKLSPADSANRFQLALLKFIQVFTDIGRPLVIFLDDLQWADPASLDFLQVLITDTNHPYLMIVIAYRDELTDSAHPLYRFFSQIQDYLPSHHKISLKELEFSQVQMYIADTLKSSLEAVRPLTEVIYQKTAGNPFYLNQMLTSIEQDKLLYFNFSSGYWEWELHSIQDRESFSDVIRIIMDRFSKLRQSTQAVLRLAACIGSKFDLQLLAWVYGHDVQQTLTDLTPAITEGLVLSIQSSEREKTTNSAGEYMFLHDRVQQTAYEGIAGKDKIANHLHIGRLMQQRMNVHMQEKYMFEMAFHLNYGSSMMTDHTDRRMLAELNWRAGRQAKKNAAFVTALELFISGLALLEGKDIAGADVLFNQLMLERSECEYLCGNFNEAENILDQLLKKAHTPMERYPIYIIYINMYAYQNHFEQVKHIAVIALKELGFSVSSKISSFQLLLEIIRTGQFLQKRLNQLDQLPELEDPRLRAIGEVIMASASHLGIADPNLSSAIFLRYTRQAVKCGSSEAVAITLSASTVYIFFTFKNDDVGLQLVETSMRLSRRYNNPILEGKIHLMIAIINQYQDHLESNKQLERSIQLGAETQDYIYKDFGIALHALSALSAFGSLDELQGLYQKYLDMTNKFFRSVGIRVVGLGMQYIRALKGQSHDWRTLDLEIDVNQSILNHIFNFCYFSCRIEIHYLFGCYSEVLELVKQSSAWRQNYAPIHLQQVQYYRFLSITALFPQLSTLEQSKQRIILRHLLRKMKQWSIRSPQSALHKYALMSAEWARLNGKDLEAMKLYDEAIQNAIDAGYMQHEAIARELAAKYYEARGMNHIAELYLILAYQGYAKWGATQKVDQMLRMNPLLQLEQSVLHENPDTLPITDCTSNSNLINFLDMDALRQATTIQTIEEFLELAIVNSRAERGVVVQNRAGEITIVAGGNVNQQSSLISNQSISLMIIQYVIRTNEPVILDDAAQSQFASDPYIIHDKPKSILCLPLRISAQTHDVIYLENNFTTHAFAADRSHVLTMLASQAYSVINLLQSFSDPDLTATGGFDNHKPSAILIDPLTDREMQVLNLMAAGLSNREIAEELGVVVGTVKNHVKNIFSKLQVNKRMKAVAQAKELRLLNIGD